MLPGPNMRICFPSAFPTQFVKDAVIISPVKASLTCAPELAMIRRSELMKGRTPPAAFTASTVQDAVRGSGNKAVTVTFVLGNGGPWMCRIFDAASQPHSIGYASSLFMNRKSVNDFRTIKAA
ncbi:MAG: hypothetical protein BWY66_01382 [bacterium ADurb.Bin374]|nr:MAG: hypothetical protein BWY66_01382 [bacterium ADurb.Bin374]